MIFRFTCPFGFSPPHENTILTSKDSHKTLQTPSKLPLSSHAIENPSKINGNDDEVKFKLLFSYLHICILLF